MTRFDYDLFVIGGGSGGVRAARIAAEHGARVAIAESFRYGGTCVIRGCVPKKLFVYASEYRHTLADAAAYGWDTAGPARFDWATLIANKDAEIDRLNGIYIKLLERAGVEIFHGRATLDDAHTVAIDGAEPKRVTAQTILIATGSRPRLPHIPGGEHVITSNEAFHLPRLPAHITVVGGGYIAVEFAHIFAGMGASVSLVHRGAKVLRGFDDDVRADVTEGLASHSGVDNRLSNEINRIDKLPSGRLQATLKTGGTLETDVILCAIGRIPNTDNMGLEAIGVSLQDEGAVAVSAQSQTTVNNIFAVGDCTDRVNLTPIAIREGQAFADAQFGGGVAEVDYEHIPTAVFSQPPVGTVGLTEAQARERYGDIDIYLSRFRPMKYTLPGRQERTMMKLVVDRDSQRVVGVHMVGLDAAEMIQCVAVAVRMGATKADLDATVAVHPTTAEELVLMRTKTR